MNIEKKRINLFMPLYMVEALDNISDELGGNRTSVVNMIIRQYLDQREVVKMSQMIDAENKRQREQLQLDKSE